MFGLRKKLFVLLPMAPRIAPGPPVESSMHYSCGHTIRDTDCNSTEAGNHVKYVYAKKSGKTTQKNPVNMSQKYFSTI